MQRRFCQILVLISLGGVLVACSSGPEPVCTDGTCTLAPKRATSRPYTIKGVKYCPQQHYEYCCEGIASYYGGGDIFHGRPTATGERFDMNGVTAAHKTLPLPCIAEVTNLENGRQIQVKVNDRGPFVTGRIIDVSRRVAQLLGFEGKGTAKVRVKTLVAESLALNNIKNPTVMMAEKPAQSVNPIPEAAAVLLVETFPSLPEDLFEDLSENLVEAEPLENLSSSPILPSPVHVRASTASVDTGIFVQVGNYATHQEAQNLSSVIEDFKNVSVKSLRNAGAKPYAVRVGPFASMSQANEALDQLADAGHVMSRIVIAR